MSNLNLEEKRKMPDSEAKRKWMQENSFNLTLKFMRRTEPDIIEFLETQASKGVAKATIIKTALREYMENHKEE